MHNCQCIEENICFSNGGTNLHIHTIAQCRTEDNQIEFLQGPHGIVNPPKTLYLRTFVGSSKSQMDYCHPAVTVCAMYSSMTICAGVSYAIRIT